MTVFRVTVEGQLQGQLCQNVLHFNKPQGTDNDKPLLVQAVIDRLLGQWRFLQVRDFNWNQVTVSIPANDNDQPLIFPTVMSGLHAEEHVYALPLTAVFKIKTFTAGRAGRGRVCIAGPPASALFGGRWNQNYLNDMQSVRNSHIFWFRTDNPGSGFVLGVCSHSGLEGDFKAMDDFIRRDYPGTQVRRNFFRGR